MADEPGLTGAQVAKRRAAGRVNVTRRDETRSLRDIVRANVFTRFNAIIGVLLAIVLVFGPLQDALFGLVIVVNSAVGIVQEWRAKKKLDALALLERAPVRVRRDRVEVEIPPDEVVVGDLILLGPGEKVPVDGTVREAQGLELDESLLTGEADPIAKQPGDTVRSGSFVVAGAGAFKAVHVGDDAYANRLVANVRRFELSRSELMTGINQILRAITYVVLPLGLLLVISQLLSAGSFADAMVRTVAGIVPTIPEGLVLMTSVAFAVGVVRLAQRRCLVQELPAIELLARVDVLCLDKTGTLTAPELDLDEVRVAPGEDKERVMAALGALARMEERPNATMLAIASEVDDHEGWTPDRTLPFSSARKYSAATFPTQGTWGVGAPDILLPQDDSLRTEADTAAAQGLRVLALVEMADPEVPLGKPKALVILRQRLRPEAAQTMRYLADEGVTLKVLSGDHPAAVGAVAAQAGIAGAESPVDARREQDVIRHSVFGRVTPEQKRTFVDTLRANGHTVGMTGDGVNDALALKNADLGIAMGSGSPATRGVAKVVLLDNNFGTVPHVLAEGRRVLGNIERVASLFLVKTTYSLVLAAIVGLAHVPFPLLPRHTTLVGSLTIGIPGFFLALAPNSERFRPGFVGRVLGRAVPAGLVCGVAAFTAYGLARLVGASDQTMDSSTAAATLFFSAAWMLALVARPWTWWRVGLVAAMVGAFLLVAAVPFGREFFALDFSNATNDLITLGVSALAVLAITVVYRIDNAGTHVMAALTYVRTQIARLRDVQPSALVGGGATVDLMPGAAARRAGYAFAVVVTVVVWFALTAWPGWQDIGFLTEDFTRVLPLVQVSLLVTVLAYLVYTLHDVLWLRTVGAVVTSGFGLATLVALWRVFPFTFADSGWGTVFRVGLAFAMLGTVLDLLTQLNTFLRARR